MCINCLSIGNSKIRTEFMTMLVVEANARILMFTLSIINTQITVENIDMHIKIQSKDTIIIGTEGSSANLDINPKVILSTNKAIELYFINPFLLNNFVNIEVLATETAVVTPIKAENNLDINKSSVMSLNILLE